MKEQSFELVNEADIAKLLKGPSAWVLKNDDLWGEDYARFIVDNRVLFLYVKPGPRFGMAQLTAIIARTEAGQEHESPPVRAFIDAEAKTWGANVINVQGV